MEMPQVCKELQREPTGTITPEDTQREEESRVIDALSLTLSAVNTLLYIGRLSITPVQVYKENPDVVTM